MNVIFDMDGLMFDTEKVFVKAWRYAGEKAGLGDTGYMAIKTLGMNEEACEKVWYETHHLINGIRRRISQSSGDNVNTATANTT